jgi:hypothetical protein
MNEVYLLFEEGTPKQFTGELTLRDKERVLDDEIRIFRLTTEGFEEWLFEHNHLSDAGEWLPVERAQLVDDDGLPAHC